MSRIWDLQAAHAGERECATRDTNPLAAGLPTSRLLSSANIGRSRSDPARAIARAQLQTAPGARTFKSRSARGARVSLAPVTTCLYLHHLAPFPCPPASSLLVIPQPDTPTLLQPAPDLDAEPCRPSAEQTVTIMATQFSFLSQQDRWFKALRDAPSVPVAAAPQHPERLTSGTTRASTRTTSRPPPLQARPPASGA